MIAMLERMRRGQDGISHEMGAPQKSLSVEDLPSPSLDPEALLILKQERGVDEEEKEEPEEIAGSDNGAEEYEWEKKEKREDMEESLRDAIARFKKNEEADDTAEPEKRKEGLKSEGAMRPAQGWRGKEPRSKSRRRGESIRKTR